MRAWLAQNRGGLGVGLLGMALIGAVSWLWRPAPTPVAVVIPTPAPSATPQLVVHLAGEVQRPGVYQLPGNARVADGIAAAGGATDEANLDALNLAARLVDGQRVLVPSRTSVGSPSEASGRTNLNRASRAELEALPGIGPAIAQRILEYRDRNGPFRSFDQLRETRLINAPTLERLRDLIVFE